MTPIIVEGTMTTIGEIVIVTGIITGSTDAMITTIDGIADEIAIIIITITMIGVAAYATITDSASSLRQIQ